jgi:regulator of protease activity HflC (stomatin/prohibitin superfamily)
LQEINGRNDMDLWGLPSNLIFVIIFVIILAASSIKSAKESERIAIYRLGRFVGIVGPGLVFMIPGLDKVVRINLNDLNKKVPGWQALPKEELGRKIESFLEDVQ